MGLGVQYDVNARSGFSLSYRGNFDDQRGSQESRNRITTISESNLYRSYINKNEDRRNHSYILNYNNKLDSAGSALFIGSQYTRYRTATNDLINENNLVNDNELTKVIRNEVAQDISISSTQADFTKVLNGDRRLEAGVKFSYANNNSGTDFLVGDETGVFEPDTELSSNFKYKEMLPAAYLNYNTTLGKSVNVAVGLRGEWTHFNLNTTAGKGQVITSSYLNIFPNIFLSKSLTERLKVRASYVSKITRPRYQALNPFVIYQDPFTTIEGNPTLKPEKIHAFELGANCGALDVRAGFNYTVDPLSAAALRGTKPNSYVLKALNLQKDYTFLTSVSYSLNLSWWNSTNTATVTYSKSIDNQFDFVFFSPKPQIYLYSSNTFNVRNLFKVQVLAWYLGDRYYGLYYNKNRSTVTLGIEKAFFANAFTMRFTANDIFHQTNAAGTYSVGQTDIYFDRSFSTNYFRLAATYRFGKSAKVTFNSRSTGEAENSRAR
ncbi:outer membrane beta-barrel family protein [Dyadobacter sp. CY343]|uniref:outer membrane beta-barrel family protein n=1 Tax=Dyadobacter sp. CY343 TaxID=2907299 RepID=UPI0038D38069